MGSKEAASGEIGLVASEPHSTSFRRNSLASKPQNGRIANINNLKVYYTNSRSLGNKMNDLRALVSTEKIDIIAISETWMRLESHHYKAEYQINGFNLFNTDRNPRRKGGGVAVYVKDNFKCCIKPEIKSGTDTETVWIEIKDDRESLVFGVIYRPPNLDREHSNIIWEEITRASRYSKVCIVGDFNYRNINWIDKTGDYESDDFLEVINDNFLHQYVTEPTRGNNILDLVLSNSLNLVQSVEVGGGSLGGSDHKEITFCLKLIYRQSDNVSVVPNFRQANYAGLRHYLRGAGWDAEEGVGLVGYEQALTDTMTVEDEYRHFMQTIHSGQELNIPSKQFRSGKNDPRWMNNKIKYLIGQKKGLYRKIKRGEIRLQNKYIEVNRQTKKEIRKAKRGYEIKIAKESKVNPKGFYQMYQTRARENIGPLVTAAGQTTEDAEDMCRMFNEYFLSVFTEENLVEIPAVQSFFIGSIDNALSRVIINKQEVEKEIDRLKPQKSPGPDEIYARVLKECKIEVSSKLSEIFNKSLESGEVPEAWKLANIIPIFKKGSRTATSNYRPVSLTSTVGKLLESIIARTIRNHLETFKLIKDSQHGFTKGRSCLTNLLSFFSEVYEAVDKDKAYDVVYLDFSKAFDRVPHERLIRKVEAHGIRGGLLKWIKAWLTGRKQRVSINGIKSDWATVTSGVPQGSVLGPLLFIIYINDLDVGINSNISKFADDTKIGRVMNSTEDNIVLQKDLDQLVEWSEKWQMKFNIEKCKVLKLGRLDNGSRYQLDNLDISISECERDLGVMVSKDLKPRQNCINVRNKANRVLGFISRSVSNRSASVIMQLYLALVRPHLDYAVQFWSPYYRMDINSLEGIQRRMTKMIHNIRNLPYEGRLKHLNLHSLERRRVRGDLIEAFKWIKGINKGDINKVLKFSSQNITRSNGFKLDKFRFQKEIGRHWFGNRVVNEWNKLPREIVSAETVVSFKNRLDKYMDGKGWV